MPYIPPHLRPGYVPLEQRPNYVPPVVKTGTRFISNVNDRLESNVQPNTGKRYSPHTHAKPAKKSLKSTRKVTPNTAPVQRPSTRIDDWATRYRAKVLDHIKKAIREKQTKKKTRRHSRSKMCKTRKGRRVPCRKQQFTVRKH